MRVGDSGGTGSGQRFELRRREKILRGRRVFQVALQEPLHKPHGIVIIDHLGPSRFVQTLLDGRDDVCDAAGAGEHADQLALLEGNGELTKRARTSRRAL